MKTIIQGINVEQIRSTLSPDSTLSLEDINYLKLFFLLKEE